MEDTEPDIALVTGAASGIGRAIARRFHEEGLTVIALDRSEKDLRLLSDEMPIIPAVFDLGDTSEIPSLIERLVLENGPISILVNNAGAWHYEPIVKITEDTWEHIFRINVTAPFLLIREIAPVMLGAGRGTIVNIASRNAMVSSMGSAAYDSSKAALVALTRTAAGEFASKGICVNAICPGVINTTANDDLLADQKALDDYLKLIPQARYGEPEEIAGLTYFLTTKDARFITGQTIVADGGQMAFSDWKRLFE
jgi:NAD(P)-dependent dehydrogenase (short-subunit alcohol dehydrogenase family)